jgi:hypothetical protein
VVVRVIVAVAVAVAATVAGGGIVIVAHLRMLTPGSPARTSSTGLGERQGASRLWLLCVPRPAPLDDAQIEDLRTAFGARW